MRTNNILFLIIGFIVAFSSCDRKGPEVDPDDVGLRHTLIAYLGGDNNLSSEINAKIEALSKGMSNYGGKDAKVVAFADYRDIMPRLIEISSSGSKVLEVYPVLNSANPQNLNVILSNVIELYPSDSYGLLVFSHASGWVPPGMLYSPASTKSIIQDNSDEMPLTDFCEALPLPDNGKYDYVVFEACHMAGIEVAVQLQSKADYMIASAAEIVSPGFVDIYPDHLSKLLSESQDLVGFADEYFKYWDSRTGAARSATISVIDESKVDRLAEIYWDIVSKADTLDRIALGDVQSFDRSMDHLFYDVDAYVAALSPVPSQYEEFKKQLSEAVVYGNATDSFMKGYPYSFDIESHCGLTVYVMKSEFVYLNEKYQELDFYKKFM